MEWRNRDWVWVVGILIVVIILLISTIFAKNKGVEVNFTIISSAVSIALALVAIFFALKQDSDNRRVNDNVSTILHNIVSEMGSVKNSVEKITGNDIDTIAKNTLEEITDVDKQPSYSSEEVKKLVEEAINNFSLNVKTKVENVDNIYSTSNSLLDLIKLKKLINEIENEENDKVKSISYIQKELKTRHGLEIPKSKIANLKNDRAGF